jgi:DNA-binding YbaB/EbfC family protein
MKNIANFMKQAQEMQTKMTAMQEQLATLTVEGQAGGFMVTVTMSCKGEIRQVKIDPSLLKPEEVDILEDLIMAACNDAKAKAETLVAEEMAKITGGLKLPGGMQLPF